MPLDLSNPKITQYKIGDKGILCFLGGESGMGKTALGRGLIEKYGRDEVLFLDVENRLAPLAELEPYRWGNGPIEHTRQIDECIEYLRSQVTQGKPHPKVLMFDSLSEWSDLRMREVQNEIPDATKDGTFKRFRTLGETGLDLVVRVRSIPQMIKIINCTMNRRPLAEGGGYEFSLFGNIVPDNLARKVDELFVLVERTLDPGLFSPQYNGPLKPYIGMGPVRLFQTGNYDGIAAKDSSTKLALFEPTESRPGARDGWPLLLSRINPALAPATSGQAPQGGTE